MDTRRGRPYADLDAAEVVRLRDAEEMSWHQIGQLLNARDSTVRRAYSRHLTTSAPCRNSSSPCQKSAAAIPESEPQPNSGPEPETKPSGGTIPGLGRFNIVLAPAESEFLDRLAQEICAKNGARVSRSQIIRAGIAGLQELDRLAPVMPLASCRSGSDLVVMMVLAIRMAADGQGRRSRKEDPR